MHLKWDFRKELCGYLMHDHHIMINTFSHHHNAGLVQGIWLLREANVKLLCGILFLHCQAGTQIQVFCEEAVLWDLQDKFCNMYCFLLIVHNLIFSALKDMHKCSGAMAVAVISTNVPVCTSAQISVMQLPILPDFKSCWIVEWVADVLLSEIDMMTCHIAWNWSSH